VLREKQEEIALEIKYLDESEIKLLQWFCHVKRKDRT
jgi:hypothetical protein